MGTSSSGNGPRPTTPLVPNWIPTILAGDPLLPPPPDEDDEELEDDESKEDNSLIISPNRFLETRKSFNKYIRNTTTNRNALHKSLKSYVRKASGGSSTLATRMRPSASRIVSFYNVINTLKEQGPSVVLRSFNLENYANRPLLEVLSALMDVVFNDSNDFNDIQDDSITKLAYANTVNRIVETENIDLNNLTNENIEAMTAIFIEETIATRVICDVGVKLFKNVQNSQAIIEIEETIYQIVTGLVRNQIMAEIITTQRTSKNIDDNIQNIYRIAFDCIAEITQ